MNWWYVNRHVSSAVFENWIVTYLTVGVLLPAGVSQADEHVVTKT